MPREPSDVSLQCKHCEHRVGRPLDALAGGSEWVHLDDHMVVGKDGSVRRSEFDHEAEPAFIDARSIVRG